MKKRTWRGAARELIAELIMQQFSGKPVNSKDELKQQFRRLLYEAYPWQRHGQAYNMWNSEKAIALDYIELVYENQRSAEHFKSYSLALFKNRTHRRRVDVVAPGQIKLL